mmetsp:Transcript_2698/g.9071  ORF Transcript_2698/g.9071 Transcript_2698/m.9071 type:complete len:243 (+) Transcript_2698:754-1482(+)
MSRPRTTSRPCSLTREFSKAPAARTSASSSASATPPNFPWIPRRRPGSTKRRSRRATKPLPPSTLLPSRARSRSSSPSSNEPQSSASTATSSTTSPSSRNSSRMTTPTPSKRPARSSANTRTLLQETPQPKSQPSGPLQDMASPAGKSSPQAADPPRRASSFFFLQSASRFSSLALPSVQVNFRDFVFLRSTMLSFLPPPQTSPPFLSLSLSLLLIAARLRLAFYKVCFRNLSDTLFRDSFG